MKNFSLGLVVAGCVLLSACKSKIEQCNAFVDKANGAQKVVQSLKLDSEDAAELEKVASSVDAEANSFKTLELKDEKLLEYRTKYADTLLALGKIAREAAEIQKDAKDPSKAAGLEAKAKKLADDAKAVEKSESDVVDALNQYCTGSK
jgi:hypothetical protein